MNLFTRTFSKIFKSSNQQELDKIQNIVEAINNKEKETKSLTEADFKEKTNIFKKNAQNGSLDINNIVPESFALVREAAKRTLGERHYDVQLAGGLILHNGKIAEMKTGEGKTCFNITSLFKLFNRKRRTYCNCKRLFSKKGLRVDG